MDNPNGAATAATNQKSERNENRDSLMMDTDCTSRDLIHSDNCSIIELGR